MDLRMVHLYPDLMNLYGSWGNAAVLKRTFEAMGHTAAIERIVPGERPALSQADVIFLGAGTEGAQKAALSALLEMKEELQSAAADGVLLLFVGSAMELLGRSVTGADGRVYPALEIGSFTAVQQTGRLVGDVYGHTALFDEAVVGFMNKCARITGVDTPLLSRLDLGIGNEGRGTPEGFHRDNVFASELTGPILIKNPALLQAVAAAVCRRRGAAAEEVPVEAYLRQSWALTARQLKERANQRSPR